MIYLTFNDAPGGVYYSQVIGVCKYLQDDVGGNVNLVSIISARNFAEERKKIKSRFPSAIVLPAFPKMANWQRNAMTLKIASYRMHDRCLMARGALAAGLGLRLRKMGTLDKVVYDGRGAVAAEWDEYSVGSGTGLEDYIFDIEKHAVLDSDFRIAVSGKLVDHWREAFGYAQDAHAVIPCTLNAASIAELDDTKTTKKRRTEMGYQDRDIVLVYSGSSAGWQSFEVLDNMLTAIMEKNNATKVLFLAKIELDRLTCYQRFPGRIRQDWVSPDQVVQSISACDYGLMIREQSVTNQVAAPTKFAEYLAAGLPVLISPGIGDYSHFVEQNDCGFIVPSLEEARQLPLQPVPHDRKLTMQNLARKYFSKEIYAKEYTQLTQL